MLITRFLFFILFIFSTSMYAQAPAIQWQKSYGGTNNEFASSIKKTTDGGYILAGATTSNDGNVTGNHGTYDYWIVKIDMNGSILWQKTYGGFLHDRALDIIQTLDGGFIIAGNTDSAGNNDIGQGFQMDDFWIVKTYTIGNIQWQKCYGGSQRDIPHSIQQTFDGGYIVAGESNSHDGDVIGNHSFGNYMDYWVIKLDSTGTLQWQKCYGGLNIDVAYDIHQTKDSGYIIAGYASSVDGDLTAHKGYDDYWVIKTNSTGFIQWQKSMGGTSAERASSIEQTFDGGYIVAGYTDSNDSDVTGYHSIPLNNPSDYWIIKLDSLGSFQWKKCYGGYENDLGYTIKQTQEGGYIVAGRSNSTDGDVTGNHFGGDYWILKLDALGIIQWENCYGGSGDEGAVSFSPGNYLELTTDGGFILSGSSNSTDGDVTGNHGNLDYWIVKLESTIGINEINNKNNVTIYPNPSESQLYIKFTADQAEISITDIVGREIKKVLLTNEKNPIDVSDLREGLYNVSVKTKNYFITKRVFVQH